MNYRLLDLEMKMSWWKRDEIVDVLINNRVVEMYVSFKQMEF